MQNISVNNDLNFSLKLNPLKFKMSNGGRVPVYKFIEMSVFYSFTPTTSHCNLTFKDICGSRRDGSDGKADSGLKGPSSHPRLRKEIFSCFWLVALDVDPPLSICCIAANTCDNK